MFTDIEGFGRQSLVTIFLFACMLLSVRIAVGRKNNSAREAFIIGVIALMLGIQYYYLVSVASFLPASRFYVYNVWLVFPQNNYFFSISLFIVWCVKN